MDIPERQTVTHFERNTYGIDQTALEQRIAELTDSELDGILARTRFPRVEPTPAQQAQAAGRAKAQQLVDLQAQSNARANDLARMNLAPTQSDQDAAAQAAQEAAWQAASQTEAPQGFTPNRGQGAAGTPPPPTAETGAQKAGRLQQLHQQQQNGF